MQSLFDWSGYQARRGVAMGVVRMWSSTAIIVQACVIEIASYNREVHNTQQSSIHVAIYIG